MKCGMTAINAYLKYQNITAEYKKEGNMTIRQVTDVLEEYGIIAKAYWTEGIQKESGIVYFPKYRHYVFMERKGGWVCITDSNAGTFWFPVFLTVLLGQRIVISHS